MKKLSIVLLIGIVTFFGSVPLQSRAQTEEQLQIRLRRDFGYSSGTGRIQGTFTIKASSPIELVKVVFLIDGEPIGEDSQAPFELRFQTDNYPLGKHVISAMGLTIDGRELSSNEISGQFVNASEGWQTAIRILVIVIGITAVAGLLSIGITYLTRGKGQGSVSSTGPRNYGLFGAAICPNCKRPFGRHIWGLNIVVGKLDRCPHCGKWSIVQRASPLELEMAEIAERTELEKATLHMQTDGDEQLRKEIDDSRYQDL